MTHRKEISIAKIELTEHEIAAATAVLRSGALRQSEQCAAFEAEYAEYVGAEHAVTCANGSAALHLPFFCMLEPGDEVIVPSFTFIATASMVALTGARPVFCDVDPDSFLFDLGLAERLVTERTKMVVPVHLFGNPCSRRDTRAFADRHGLAVVWDAAQAHSATLDGSDVGAWDDVIAYSFYPSKNMFVGEGGMVCTNDPNLARRLREARNHGQPDKYYHTSLGFNYRMTDVEAAIGRAQLTRLDSMLDARRNAAAILLEGLAGVSGVTPQQVTPGSSHAWHQFCVTVDPEVTGVTRGVLAERLLAMGVSTAVHYPRGLHQQPIFREMYGDVEMPVTERLADRILALPVHHGLTPDDAHYVVACVLRAVSGA